MKHIILKILHIHCLGHGKSIIQHLQSIKGVKSTSINTFTGTAHVEFNTSETSENSILTELKRIGLTAIVYEKELEKEEKRLKAKQLSQYKRKLILSAFVSLVLIGGLTYPTELLNNSTKAALVGVTLIYGLSSHFKKAFQYLLKKIVDFNVLFVFGITSLYLHSIASAFFQSPYPSFFETTSILLTIILIGNFLEKKHHNSIDEHINKTITDHPHLQKFLEEQKDKEFTPLEQKITTISYYAPLGLLLTAVITFLIWTFLLNNYLVGLMSCVSILLITFPCTLNQSYSIPLIWGQLIGASQGVLLKDREYLQKIAKAKTIVFNKTGTLTQGKPEISNIIPQENYNVKRLLLQTAAVMKENAHPFSKLIVKEVEHFNHPIPEAKNVQPIEGMGIIGEVDLQEMIVGSMKLMEQFQVKLDPELTDKGLVMTKYGKTPIYIAKERKLIGVLGIQDPLQEHAKEELRRLKRKRYTLHMLTGANKKTAEAVGKDLELKNIISETPSSQRNDAIQKVESNSPHTIVVGSGARSNHLLKKASISIAFSQSEENKTYKNADITIIHPSLRKLHEALLIGNAMNTHISNNIRSTSIYSILALLVSTGLLYPFTNFVMHPLLAATMMTVMRIGVYKSSAELHRFKKI